MGVKRLRPKVTKKLVAKVAPAAEGCKGAKRTEKAAVAARKPEKAGKTGEIVPVERGPGGQEERDTQHWSQEIWEWGKKRRKQRQW